MTESDRLAAIDASKRTGQTFFRTTGGSLLHVVKHQGPEYMLYGVEQIYPVQLGSIDALTGAKS